MNTYVKNNMTISPVLLRGITALKNELLATSFKTDDDTLRSVLLSKGVSSKDATIISLIYFNSNLATFLIKDNLSDIEVNYIFHNVCETCCIAPISAKYYLNAIFLGFNYKPISDNKTGRGAYTRGNNQNGFSYDLSGSKYDDILTQIDNAINNNDASFFAKDHISVAFKKMLSEHLPVAMYLYGRCCYEGIGVPQDFKTAEQYFKEAAEQGLAVANAYLGDVYYQQEAFTQSFDHYTSLGAVALSEQRRKRLSVLLEFERINKRMFVKGIMLTFVSIVYYILMCCRVFKPINNGGTSSIVLPIIGILLTLAMAALMCLLHKFSKCDSIGYLILGVTVTMALITIVFVSF